MKRSKIKVGGKYKVRVKGILYFVEVTAVSLADENLWVCREIGSDLQINAREEQFRGYYDENS